MLISSLSNPRVKQIRALRQRKEREATRLYFVEGIRIVTEAAQLHAGIETLVVAPELLKSVHALELVAAQGMQGVPVLEVSRDVFAGLSSREGPQGLGAVMRQQIESLEQVTPGGELCWVALDAAQDPGNIGAILRTSDAVGGAGLILLGNAADPYDPAAVRASMGALFAQRVVRADWGTFVAWKRQHAVTVVGTSDKAVQEYRAAAYPSPLVLLMGSEREGLSPARQAVCDHMVRIPMVGRSDSLNLAVATAIVLYEVFYQQGNPS
jgi:RNA methyltransferase, TrmH family